MEAYHLPTIGIFFIPFYAPTSTNKLINNMLTINLLYHFKGKKG